MGEHIKIIGHNLSKNIWFWITSSISFGLLIAGFIFPPPGEIHSSVLIAVSELFAFSALGVVIRVIEKGGTASIHKGDLHMDLKGKDKEEDC